MPETHFNHIDNTTDNLLLVNGLSIHLKQGRERKQLVNNLSFQIKSGRFTALIGKSGIGKSLTIKAILGLLNGDRWKLEGDIIFYKDREEIFILKDGKYNKELLSQVIGRDIVPIFQGADSHLHPSLTIEWQIGETIDSSRPWRNTEEVAKRLDTVRLSIEELKCYPHQLSQGQRQRVAIAMALNYPRIIIADEITTALDEKVKEETLILLKKLRQEKRIDSLLFVTHDLSAIEKLFDIEDILMVMNKKEGIEGGVIEFIKFKDVGIHSQKSHPFLSQDEFSRYKRTKKRQDALNGKPILWIKGLRQDYYRGLIIHKAKTVIDALDLKVRMGEFFGIKGKSGCGKTTLVKSIVRLLNHTQGSVFFNSEKFGWCNLIRLQPHGLKSDCFKMAEIRKEIQVIFQDSASIFNPKMTIRELLSETLEITGIESFAEQLSQMKDALFKFGICNNDRDVEEVLNRYPGELSGGERQRLAILRVLLLNPRLVIADEPFTDQDKITKEEIIQMMDKIRRENNTTFIIISHELDLISSICDRIGVMDERRIVEISCS